MLILVIADEEISRPYIQRSNRISGAESESTRMKHFLHMLIGCGLPMLLIFVLPYFGVSEGVTLTVFMVLMLGCHLLMMRGHTSDHSDHHTKHQEHRHE